jgi:hypothetical protein
LTISSYAIVAEWYDAAAKERTREMLHLRRQLKIRIIVRSPESFTHPNGAAGADEEAIP